MSRLVLPTGGVVNWVTVTSSGAPATTGLATAFAAPAPAAPLAAAVGPLVVAPAGTESTGVMTPSGLPARCSATTGAGRSGAVACGRGLTTGAPVTTATATTVATASLARETSAGLVA